jgi:hypothetical protein
MPGALHGIRVVDFGHYVAGPLLTELLAQNGADVVHVDRPGRPTPPPRLRSSRRNSAGYSASHDASNESHALHSRVATAAGGRPTGFVRTSPGRLSSGVRRAGGSSGGSSSLPRFHPMKFVLDVPRAIGSTARHRRVRRATDGRC